MTPSKASVTYQLPPGNMGFPLVGESLSFILDRDFATKRHEEYGSIFKTSILGAPTIFVKGGEAVRFVLANENKYFVTHLIGSTRALLGDLSLSVQTGSLHQNRRRLLLMDV